VVASYLHNPIKSFLQATLLYFPPSGKPQSYTEHQLGNLLQEKRAGEGPSWIAGEGVTPGYSSSMLARIHCKVLSTGVLCLITSVIQEQILICITISQILLFKGSQNDFRKEKLC